jgi:hypothetical protein
MRSATLDSGLRLILAGVPSLVGLVIGTLFLLPPDRSIVVGLTLIALSAVLFVVAVGKARSPVYLLVPLMVPVGLLISPDGKAIPGLFVGALMLTALAFARFIERRTSQ